VLLRLRVLGHELSWWLMELTTPTTHHLNILLVLEILASPSAQTATAPKTLWSWVKILLILAARLVHNGLERLSMCLRSPCPLTSLWVGVRAVPYLVQILSKQILITCPTGPQISCLQNDLFSWFQIVQVKKIAALRPDIILPSRLRLPSWLLLL